MSDLSERACAYCRWRALHPWQDGDLLDEDDLIQCVYPAERLPLSMSGVALRERELVLADKTGCPCWEALK